MEKKNERENNGACGGKSDGRIFMRVKAPQQRSEGGGCD